MRDKYQKELLSILLDKYENSSFYKTGVKPSRRIMLRLYDGGSSDYLRYNIEQSEIREHINQAIMELREKDIVDYQWMKGEDGYIMARIWLKIDNIDKVYTFLNRKSANELTGKVCQELQVFMGKVSTGWIKAFIDDCYAVFSEQKGPDKLSRYINQLRIDEDERQDLFQALLYIDSLKETELLERVFSIRCFGNSKKFELKIKKRLLDIIKNYSDCDDDSNDEELLRFAGIMRYPQQFEFRGSLSIIFKDELQQHSIDFSPFIFGASINSLDIKRGTVILTPEIKSIISIENWANYYDYINRKNDKTELIIFHGGQFSPAKKLFFKAITDAMPGNCLWYHWGDIDYGGFSMLARLRREIKHNILPYRMNRDELIRHENFVASIKPGYVEKLRTLLRREELIDCFPCLNYMIENNIRLEQEAMILSNNEQ
jgi:hypothetical protein